MVLQISKRGRQKALKDDNERSALRYKVTTVWQEKDILQICFYCICAVMDKASFDIPATHHHMATVNDNEFGVVDGVVKIGPWEYVLHDRHHHNNNNNNNHNGFEDSRLQEQLEYETWVKDPGTAGTKASTSSFSSSSKAEGQGETGSNASSSSPSGSHLKPDTRNLKYPTSNFLEPQTCKRQT